MEGLMDKNKYRLIYNWDGNPHAYSAYPQSMDEFLDKVFAPIENTQVDTLFWCVGKRPRPEDVDYIIENGL